MRTLEENVKQAIADFDGIKAAIEEKGMEVPDGTDTNQYGNKIRLIGADQYDRGYEDGLAARTFEIWTITLADGSIIEKEVALL